MELILRFNLEGNSGVIDINLLIPLIFSMILAAIMYLIATFFKDTLSYLSSFLLLLTAGFIFSSQFIYVRFFRTFYSFYSAGNASQIFEFWPDIQAVIADNLLWLFLFFLPALFFLFWGRRLFHFGRISNKYRALLIGSTVLIHLTGVTAVWVNGQEQNSAYDLYFQTRDPVLSVDRLGMITTMRLDLQRLMTGWSPTHVAPDMPVFEPEPEEEPIETVVDEETDTTGDVVRADEEEGNSEKEKEKEIEYNTLPIDFEELIKSENNADYKQMHQYFNSVEPTAKNEYTGKFEGYNLIFITAESYAPYAVDEEITPTLYKMMHEGYDFTDFYVPLWDVSSSDGEYVSMTSLVPKSGIWSFSASADIELPFVMGNTLKENGYNTVAYHNHSYTYYNRDASHPNLGYEYTGIGNGLDISGGWPRSDLEMMQASVPEYIDEEPFHAYYITVSGHMQYSFAGNNIAYQNRDHVKDLPYSDQAKAYLATQIELDKALENLLSQLEEKGIADKTLIALTTDHYPYGLDNSTIDELAGHEVDKVFELHKNSLLLYTKGMNPLTIDKPSSNLDIVPTLYNLLGIDYDSRLFMGTDIFSDSSPLVMLRNKSFITDRGKYNAATNEFIPREDDSDENFDEYIDAVSLILDNKFYYSVKILETDYYSTLK